MVEAGHFACSDSMAPDLSVYINGKKYPLPEQVVKNIETVVGMVPLHRRVLQKTAAAFGTAAFLYAEIGFFVLWISASYSSNTLPAGIPRYQLQSHLLDTAALLITTGVLIHQTRQEKLAEQRSHLMLQLNLLTEQKAAKLIGLLEEMRAELPELSKRRDLEAEIMQQTTDPQAILDILRENLAQSEQAGP